MDPGVVRVGRKLEDGGALSLAEVVAVMLGSSTAVAYGPHPARRLQTLMGDLKAIIRVCIMTGKGKVNWVRRTLAVVSKLRLRNGSFRLPTWRRPIFNSDASVAEETTGGHALDIWSSADLQPGDWSAATTTTMTVPRWESVNGRDVARVSVLCNWCWASAGRPHPHSPRLHFKLYLLLAAVCQGSVNSRACIKCSQTTMGLLGFTRLRQAHGVDHRSLAVLPMLCLFRCSLLLLLFSFVFPSCAIKFTLPAYRWPQKKCLWNPVHDNTLVIVTVNTSPGPSQRTDIEIIDSSPQQNVYLRKKGIKAETRLAVTTHSGGEVGVCFYNYLEPGQCNIHTYLMVLVF